MRTFPSAVRKDRFYALFLLAVTTGLRRSELCGLRWTAVDLEDWTIAVEAATRVVVNGQAVDSDGKSATSLRLLSIDPRTVAALIEWRATQLSEEEFFGCDYLHSGRVFTWQQGNPVHPDTIRQRFSRLAERAGLPQIRLHDVRHSYATVALRAGVNPKIVSQRLGHSSVAFTLSTYSHARPGFDREAATSRPSCCLPGPAETSRRGLSDGAVSKSISTRHENGPSEDL